MIRTKPCSSIAPKADRPVSKHPAAREVSKNAEMRAFMTSASHSEGCSSIGQYSPGTRVDASSTVRHCSAWLQQHDLIRALRPRPPVQEARRHDLGVDHLQLRNDELPRLHGRAGAPPVPPSVPVLAL